MRAARDLCLAVATGTLVCMGFPTAWYPDLDLWWLLWLSHVPILWVLKDKPPKKAFAWGLCAGFVVNGGGYYWIGQLLVTFGHLPWSIAILGWVLHSVHLGLIWAIWAWLMNRIENTTRMGVEWAAPLAMVAVEFVYPRIFPAFMGNSQFSFPLVMQVADLFGIWVVTFLILRVNATLYLWVRAIVDGRDRPMKATWATLAMMAGSLLYGQVRMVQLDEQIARARTLKVGIVEGDVGIFEKEPLERRENHLLIEQHLSAKLEAEGAELIVWPESSYRQTFLPRQAVGFSPSRSPLVENAEADRQRGTPQADRDAPIRGFATPLLFGTTTYQKRDSPRFENDRWQAFNTGILLDRDGRVVDMYDKSYLLVFGEYVPFSETFPWIYSVIPTAGDLSAGKSVGVFEADLWGKGPIRIAMAICYEGILPSFMLPIAAGNPHFIVNLTNDDWFGVSAERYLHLSLTVPRAIEHRVAFIRSTLTGVSAVVDPNGRVVTMTSPAGSEKIIADVPLLQSRTLYQVIGDAFAWLAAGLCVVFYLYGRIRRG